MIIIMRFGKNNVLCPKYIDIYEFQEGMRLDVDGPPFIFCLLFKKMEKVQKRGPMAWGFRIQPTFALVRVVS